MPQSLPQLDDHLLLDFYDGAYGPTILVNVPTEELLRWLRNQLQRLADTPGFLLDLAGCEEVICGNMDSLILANTAAGASKALRRKRKFSKLLVFYWNQSPSKWAETLQLVDPLTPCHHQYLTNEGVDDALVELSYKEGLTVPPGMTFRKRGTGSTQNRQ